MIVKISRRVRSHFEQKKDRIFSIYSFVFFCFLNIILNQFLIPKTKNKKIFIILFICIDDYIQTVHNSMTKQHQQERKEREKQLLFIFLSITNRSYCSEKLKTIIIQVRSVIERTKTHAFS